MATLAILVSLEDGALAAELEEASSRLENGEREVVLDFSSVHRLSAAEVHAIDEFTRAAEEKGIKVMERALGVDLYRALKLARQSSRLSLVA
jgi:anti-anti-sigma regulatory factor